MRVCFVGGFPIFKEEEAMRRQYLYFECIVVLCVFSFLVTRQVMSADVRDVVINEIAWMGTDASEDDEWIELYNNTSSTIDLTGWSLVSTDDIPTINLSGSISAYGYFLLERTDDTTVSDIPADQTYTGAMVNGGERLQLKDESGQIIDEVDCSSGWFAGTNSIPKETMERLHPQINGSSSGSWDSNNGVQINGQDADGNPIKGTPKTQNSVYDSSLPVTFSSLSAIAKDGIITVRWSTESEADIQGFHVLRSENEKGPFNNITTALIPVQGNGSTGSQYEFIDRNVERGKGYWYKIEEVCMNGERVVLGPVYAFPKEGAFVPVECQLFNGYPNPFNPSVRIRYLVSDEVAGHFVAIKIYSLLGREVVTLADRMHGSGDYTVEWDGCDVNGIEVSSGIYFCRLLIGGRTVETKRMVKMR